MTGGGPAHFTEVIAIYMYNNTFKYYKYGFGSAVSIIIVLLSVGLILILQSISGRIERRYE
jgi:multiple sugar transport system permease protein/raffinose/stachyose/melibiose transport system permease protein